MSHLHSSIAVVETWPINFIIKYGVAKINPKNVKIGHADTFDFGNCCECGTVPAATENASFKYEVDGSSFLTPIIYNNLPNTKQKENQ